MGAGQDFLRSLLEGFAGGQVPAIQAAREEEQLAQSMGIDVEELRKRRKAESDRAAQKELLELTDRQIAQAKQLGDLRNESGRLEALTGLAKGEGLDALTQFLPSKEGNEQTFQGTFDDLVSKRQTSGKDLLPGLYRTTPAKTREDVAAEIELERDLGDTAFEQSLQAATSEREERRTDLTEDRLDLDRERLNLSKEIEARHERYTNKSIEFLGEKMLRLKEEGRPSLSDGQAMQMAFQVMNEIGDPEDPDFMDDVAAWARDLKSSYQSHATPGGLGFDDHDRLRGTLRDTMRKMEERQAASGRSVQDFVGDVDDTSFEDDRQFDDGVPQSEAFSQPPKEEPPMPSLPARDGAGDPRWADPDISFVDLIGANPEVNTAIEKQMQQEDLEFYQSQIRHLMALGYKEEDLPDNLKTFIELIRDPKKGPGLGGVPGGGGPPPGLQRQ